MGYGRLIRNEEVQKVAGNWWIYLCIMALPLAAFFLYLRYQQPSYVVSANLINPGLDGLRNGQFDATEKLKLRFAITGAVKNLNLSVRYQRKGYIINQELYQNPPIKFQLLRPGRPGAERFQVALKGGDTYLLMRAKGDAAEFTFNKIYTTDIGSWMISKQPDYRNYKDQTIIVDVEDPETVTDKLLSDMLIASTAQDGNAGILSIEDKVLSRGQDILKEVVAQLQQTVAQESAVEADVELQKIDHSLVLFANKVDSLQNQLNASGVSEGDIQLSSTATTYLKNAREHEISRNALNFKLELLKDLEHYLNHEDLQTQVLPPVAGLEVSALDKSAGQLIVLQREAAQLLQTHLRDDPAFKPLFQQSAKIKGLMAEEVSRLKVELRSRQNALATIDKGAAERLDLMASRERNLLQLKRKQISYENQYAFLLKRKEAALLKRATNLYVNTAPAISYKQKIF